MNFTARDPDFDARVRATFDGQSFMETIGARIVHVVPGEVDIECSKQSRLTQQHGYFHAGVTSAIADTSAGLAALSLFEVGTHVLTTEYKINLVAPGSGDRLLARGRVIRPGRTLTTCKADVYAHVDGEDVLIATGLFTMIQIRGS